MTDMLRNNLAEQALLASIFNNPEIFGNITELVEPRDFYEPRHEIIYSTMYKLYNEGKSFDPVTVAGALQVAGDLQKAGGTEYLRDIVLNPNSLTNYNADPVGYAVLVKEASKRRDLAKAGESIHQAASGGEGITADDAMRIAESHITEIINKEASSDSMHSLLELIPEVFEDYKQAAEMPEGSVRGIPTGLQQLDEMTTGFQPNSLVILAARPGVGKAITLETPILTTRGWTTIGKIRAGDYVFNPAGKPVRVIKAHAPIQQEAYSVQFSNQEEIITGANHLWTVAPQRTKPVLNSESSPTLISKLRRVLDDSTVEEVSSLQELAELIGLETPNQSMLRIAGGLHSSPQFIDHFTSKRSNDRASCRHTERSAEARAGVDGEVYRQVATIAHTNPGQTFSSSELAERIFPATQTQEGAKYITSLVYKNLVSASDRFQESRSPEPVLFYNKQAFLQAYLSYLTAFTGTQLDKHDVSRTITTLEIMQTLESSSRNSAQRVNYVVPPVLSLQIPEDSQLATLSGKHNFDNYLDAREIIDIVPLNEKKWMRCLTVDSPDELFLVGNTLIPTHNSTLAVDFGRSAAFLSGKTVMMFSLEMSDKEVVNRILSAEANVRLHDMKAGTLSELDWAKLEEAKERIAKSGGLFLIDANPKASVARIRSVAQRQKLKAEGLDMIIVDYLQLMEPGPIRAGMNRENIVSEMSRGLKLLAKELGIPIIVLAQLNRKSEERTDTRPQVSDLRESGSLEQDADIIFLIHRPEVADSNNRPGEADLIVGKHRGGPTGKIPLVSMLEFSKFVPGAGNIAREPEMLSDGESGEFATTPDEIPW